MEEKREQILPEVFPWDVTGRMTDRTYTVKVEDKKRNPAGPFRCSQDDFYLRVFITPLPFRVCARKGWEQEHQLASLCREENDVGSNGKQEPDKSSPPFQ